MNDLKRVLSVQSYGGKQGQKMMVAFLKNELSLIKGCRVKVNKGNIYITKGLTDIYPCIVAHMDTVHPIEKDLTVMQVGDNLTGLNRYTMTQTGIGGDDKVGIYIAIHALKTFDNIKVVFFRDEETGCNGSYEADVSFFDDVSFVLQADRKGNTDFIVEAGGVELSSNVFQETIKEIIDLYGYHFERGLMTDVMALKEIGVNVCCANISCGYYNPHCKNEYVNISDVENCKNMMFEIIEQFGAQKFEHEYVDQRFSLSEKDFWKGWDGKQENYCTECFRGDAVLNGLCEDCIGYYKKYYETDFKTFRQWQ